MAPADVAIAFALAQRGKWYQWGATGPNNYDCSGLTQAAWKAAGVRISRTTYTQILDGVPVSRQNLAPGDLVFPTPDHVQLYIGGGKVVQAPHTGTQVQVSNLGGVWLARRVAPPGKAVNVPLGSAQTPAAGSTGGSGGGAIQPVLNPGFDPLGDAGDALSDRLAKIAGSAGTALLAGVEMVGGGVLIISGVAVLLAYTAMGRKASGFGHRVYQRLGGNAETSTEDDE